MDILWAQRGFGPFLCDPEAHARQRQGPRGHPPPAQVLFQGRWVGFPPITRKNITEGDVKSKGSLGVSGPRCQTGRAGEVLPNGGTISKELETKNRLTFKEPLDRIITFTKARSKTRCSIISLL